MNRCKTQCCSTRSLNVALLPRKIVKKEKKSGNFEVVKNSLNIILEKNIISISKQLTDVIEGVTIRDIKFAIELKLKERHGVL